jgi:hypothetical protein
MREKTLLLYMAFDFARVQSETVLSIAGWLKCYGLCDILQGTC